MTADEWAAVWYLGMVVLYALWSFAWPSNRRALQQWREQDAREERALAIRVRDQRIRELERSLGMEETGGCVLYEDA